MQNEHKMFPWRGTLDIFQHSYNASVSPSLDPPKIELNMNEASANPAPALQFSIYLSVFKYSCQKGIILIKLKKITLLEPSYN